MRGVMILVLVLFFVIPVISICVAQIQPSDEILRYSSERFAWLSEFGRDRPDILELMTIADLIIGPAADTFVIDTNFVQDGNIIICGEGVLIVDNATLTLSGHIWAQDNGWVILRNSAHLRFNQVFVAQYQDWFMDSAGFEATDATVDGNGFTQFGRLYDNSTFIARRVTFLDWSFRKVYNKSTLILEDVDYVGDLLVDDSCRVSFTRCEVILPWLQMPDNSVANIQFPDIDTVLHFELSDDVAGVDGIGYTFTVDTCYQVWWGIESFPGCSLAITNSLVMGSALRIPGSDTINFYGVTDSNFYADLTVPLPDRYFRLINSAVYSWQHYPLERTVFYIDSCTFGEMVGKNNSITYATRCTCDGIWNNMGARDSAFLSFTDGMVKSYVSVLNNATMFLKNTIVDCISPWAPPPLGANLAHNNSRLLAVNCYFEHQPQALDTALIMVVAIDNPESASVDDNIPIIGSAWLDAGPYSTLTFENYCLYWSPADTPDWTLIADSASEIDSDTLALWNTAGLEEGNYTLRLTIRDSEGDSLTAFKDILLTAVGITEKNNIPRCINIAVHPNPFNSSCVITAPAGAEIEIYDLRGTLRLRSVPDAPVIEPAEMTATRTFIWQPDETIPSGIYLVRATMEDGKCITKHIAYLK
ncbi:MAG: hypothetical protein B6D65_00510 [candidate division Zixibacteria bacterium 4484_93]|nr:MAG: hypothetical protein B6D65_00510 [candidate division Zixibacteria bacterium 4484_93]